MVGTSSVESGRIWTLMAPDSAMAISSLAHVVFRSHHSFEYVPARIHCTFFPYRFELNALQNTSLQKHNSYRFVV
jgi:hypothetical protein